MSAMVIVDAATEPLCLAYLELLRMPFESPARLDIRVQAVMAQLRDVIAERVKAEPEYVQDTLQEAALRRSIKQ